jgi:hypothetical protein
VACNVMQSVWASVWSTDLALFSQTILIFSQTILIFILKNRAFKSLMKPEPIAENLLLDIYHTTGTYTGI